MRKKKKKKNETKIPNKYLKKKRKRTDDYKAEIQHKSVYYVKNTTKSRSFFHVHFFFETIAQDEMR